LEKTPPRYFVGRLWSAVAGVLAILGVLVAESIVSSRSQHEEHVLGETFGVARVLASELAGLAAKLRLAMLVVATEQQRQLATSRPDEQALRAYVDKILASLPDVEAIRVVDATGRVIAQSKFAGEPAPGVGGQPFFERLRDRQAPEDVFSGAYRDGPGGNWVVAFARRIERPGGEFAGAAVALVAVERLEKILGATEVAPGGAIAVVGEGLEVIARHPPLQDRGQGAGASPAVLERIRRGEISGTYHAKSPVDGVERLYSYRRVPGYPLHITVGRATSEYFRHWWRDMAVVGLLASVLTIVAVGSAVMIHRAWGAQRRVANVLETQAHTDSLTGLANRRRFFEVGEAELARARRYGTPLSVLMLDIDHFKAVNDAHGHSAGDRVLQQLSRTCLEVMRTVDVVGRVGGEEFAILLPETALEGAVEVAERLRVAVAKSAVTRDEGAPIRYTVSIGVATLDGNSNLDTLLSQSDTALYDAKHGGRNRVRAFAEGN